MILGTAEIYERFCRTVHNIKYMRVRIGTFLFKKYTKTAHPKNITLQINIKLNNNNNSRILNNSMSSCLTVPLSRLEDLNIIADFINVWNLSIS